MLSSPVVDDDLDRPKVEAERSVELIGTNRTCGLAYCFTYCRASSAATSPEGLLDRPRRELQPPFRSPAPRLFAGGHGGAAIPVPIPNTEVKGSIAEGSASLGRARVGRRRLFFFALPGIQTVAATYCMIAYQDWNYYYLPHEKSHMYLAVESMTILKSWI